MASKVAKMKGPQVLAKMKGPQVMYLFSASIELDQFQINCHKPNKVLLSVNKGHNAKNTLGWILGQALVHQLLKTKVCERKEFLCQ